MNESVLFALAAVIAAGALGGWLASRVGLPAITGYILAGVALSPSVSPVLSPRQVGQLGELAWILLALIGYLIGCSIRLADLHGLARIVIGIVLGQGMLAGLLTLAVFLLYGWPLELALLFAALAWCAAPAVTLALIRESGCGGQLITLLLSVVAFSDAAAVIGVGLSLEWLRASQLDQGFSWLLGVVGPLSGLAAAIGFGLACGGLLLLARALCREAPRLHSLLLPSMLGLCLIGCTQLGLSAILAAMAMGGLVVNAGPASAVQTLPAWLEPPLFLMFFVASSTFFDPGMLADVWLVALLVTISRCLGKFAGSALAARWLHAPERVRNNMGWLLMPKAGLSTALAFMALTTLGDPVGSLVFNAILLSTLLNVLVTPPFARRALLRCCRPCSQTLPDPV